MQSPLSLIRSLAPVFVPALVALSLTGPAGAQCPSDGYGGLQVGGASSPPPPPPTPNYGGPSTGDRPGPGSPSAPGPTSPLPGSPGGGGPATPPDSPLAPDVLPHPYSIGGEEIRDPAAWQLWWEFNRDVYVQLRSIDTRGKTTGSDDFFLGAGERSLSRPGGQADLETVEKEILPPLMEFVGRGGDPVLMRETIVAAAKASRRTDAVGLWVTLKYFVENNPDLEVKRAAALGYGIMQAGDRIGVLADVARDSEAGRELVGAEEVDPELRAHALYGLGLVGNAAVGNAPDERALRREVARTLFEVAGDEEAGDEVRAAAVLALGLVPLPSAEGHLACTCGHCEVTAPEGSLQNQISWLTNRFVDPKESTAVRAQTVLALARVVAEGGEDVPAPIRLHLTDLLIDTLRQSAREAHAVRHGAVLGLSMLGDADDDELDRWVRWALMRSVRTGDRLERRWALIGLGLVGGRPGEGQEPYAGVDECRRALLHHLASGRRSERPWAALGLGVMGHWLRVNGGVLSEEVDLALRAGVRNWRRADHAGAYALAAGLRRDVEAVPALLQDLEKTRDPLARGHIALAIGMTGERSANDAFHEILTERRTSDALRARAGLALGLLSDSEVVPTLLELLEHERLHVRLGAARALGNVGDERAVKALGSILLDEDDELMLRREAAIAIGRMADDRVLPWRGVLAVGANYVSGPRSLTNPWRGGALDLH